MNSYCTTQVVAIAHQQGAALPNDKERGSSLVEYAMVLTVLFTLLFGTIDFGRALYTYHLVSSAAREGSRYAIVRGSASTLCNGSPGGCPSDGSGVTTYLQTGSTGIGINPTLLAVNVAYQPSANTGCQISGSDNPGCMVQVQVQYPFQFSLPFLPSATYTIGSTSEMVISQ